MLENPIIMEWKTKLGAIREKKKKILATQAPSLLLLVIKGDHKYSYHIYLFIYKMT